MNDMNERTSVVERLKGKAAEIFSDLLVQQAEQGAKNSPFFGLSEPEFPIELLREDTK